MMDYVVFAAGGGNDVFSAMVYIKHSLAGRNVGLVSLLGLTPFHYPHPTDKGIEPISIVPTAAMSRYIQTDPPKKINCLERHIPALLSDELEQARLASRKIEYVCLSSKYSIEEQTLEMQRIITSWDMRPGNTKLVVVDFGGDILSDGSEDSIISPELDAYSLALVESLSDTYGYESDLCVCFPGVDGELTKERLRHYLSDTYSTEWIDRGLWLAEIDKILAVIGSERQGNTLPAMKRVVSGENTFTLTKSWIVNGKKLYFSKEVTLDRELHIHHLGSLKEYSKSNNSPYKQLFTAPYTLKSALDTLVNIYSKQAVTINRVQSSDLFLQYLVKDSNGHWSNKEMPGCDRMLVDISPGCLKS